MNCRICFSAHLDKGLMKKSCLVHMSSLCEAIIWTARYQDEQRLCHGGVRVCRHLPEKVREGASGGPDSTL